MLNKTWIFLTGLILMLPVTAAGDESALLLKSRELTAEYASLLQAELKAALSEGGPVAAISVCQDRAPAIASELSRRSGAKIGRTSLRFRNPGNAPEPWQRDVLADFDTGASQEFFDETAQGETRFMKAIPTGAVCLACHGETLAAEIEAALDEGYPHDLARGYTPGQIRGAFSIVWPVAEKQQ
jgi:hypothetical protein